MVDLDELCDVLQCCAEGNGSSGGGLPIAIGLLAFVASEILPFMGTTKANGLLHFIMSLVK